MSGKLLKTPRARLLVAEGEAMVRADLTQTLSELGFEIATSTPSGEQAVALALESHPDVVLLRASETTCAGCLQKTLDERRLAARIDHVPGRHETTLQPMKFDWHRGGQTARFP